MAWRLWWRPFQRRCFLPLDHDCFQTYITLCLVNKASIALSMSIITCMLVPKYLSVVSLFLIIGVPLCICLGTKVILCFDSLPRYLYLNEVLWFLNIFVKLILSRMENNRVGNTFINSKCICRNKIRPINVIIHLALRRTSITWFVCMIFRNRFISVFMYFLRVWLHHLWKFAMRKMNASHECK